MDSQILVQTSAAPVVTLSEEEQRMSDYLEDRSCSEATRRARRADWQHFEGWCEANGIAATLPLHWSQVEKYLLSILPQYSFATAERRIATLSGLHSRAQAEGLEIENPCTHPAIRRHLKNARRACRPIIEGEERPTVTKKARKKAITYDVLSLMLATCDDSLQGVRDRALLLFAFASGGRRRSEVAAARMEDLEKVTGGYRYTLPRSKTDQEGEGLTVAILGTAGDALAAWLSVAGITSGSVFRGIDRHGNVQNNQMSCKTFARTVERRLKKAGLNASQYSAHSIRSGFVTEAANRGCSEFAIRDLTGHKSAEMVKRYYRAGDVLNNPAARICG